MFKNVKKKIIHIHTNVLLEENAGIDIIIRFATTTDMLTDYTIF